VVTTSFLLDGRDTTSSTLIRFFWRVSTDHRPRRGGLVLAVQAAGDQALTTGR
jgi:hypothetical protein